MGCRLGGLVRLRVREDDGTGDISVLGWGSNVAGSDSERTMIEVLPQQLMGHWVTELDL